MLGQAESYLGIVCNFILQQWSLILYIFIKPISSAFSHNPTPNTLPQMIIKLKEILLQFEITIGKIKVSLFVPQNNINRPKEG